MNKQESILNAALELLVEQGVHDTPVSQIAKKAGTGMGTIYNYFPNKEGLINALYIYIKQKEMQVFSTVDTNQSVKIQFENYMSVLIQFLVQNPKYFNFLGQMESSPIITEENLREGRKTVGMVSLLLEQGQKEKVVRAMEVSQLLVFIGGMVRASANWHLDNEKDYMHNISNHIQLIWDAIKA